MSETRRATSVYSFVALLEQTAGLCGLQGACHGFMTAQCPATWATKVRFPTFVFDHGEVGSSTNVGILGADRLEASTPSSVPVCGVRSDIPLPGHQSEPPPASRRAGVLVYGQDAFESPESLNRCRPSLSVSRLATHRARTYLSGC